MAVRGSGSASGPQRRRPTQRQRQLLVVGRRVGELRGLLTGAAPPQRRRGPVRRSAPPPSPRVRQITAGARPQDRRAMERQRRRNRQSTQRQRRLPAAAGALVGRRVGELRGLLGVRTMLRPISEFAAAQRAPRDRAALTNRVLRDVARRTQRRLARLPAGERERAYGRIRSEEFHNVLSGLFPEQRRRVIGEIRRRRARTRRAIISTELARQDIEAQGRPRRRVTAGELLAATPPLVPLRRVLAQRRAEEDEVLRVANLRRRLAPRAEGRRRPRLQVAGVDVERLLEFGSGPVFDQLRAAARPLRKLDGPLEIVPNLIADAIELPANVIPSVYGVGAAIVEAAQGRPERARQLWRDFIDNDPIALMAQGRFAEAGRAFVEHPLPGILTATGVGSVVSQGAGWALRRAGRMSAEPRVRRVEGTRLEEVERPPRGVVGYAVWRARDRSRQRRAERLRREALEAERQGDRDTARMLRARAARLDPTRMTEGQVRRRVDELVGMAERRRRAHAAEADRVVAQTTVRRGGPLQVLVVQGLARADRADLEKFVAELERQFPKLKRNAEKAANRRLRTLVRRSLDDPNVDLGEIARAAEQYALARNRLDDALAEAGIMPREGLEWARLVPAARTVLGARWDDRRRATPEALRVRDLRQAERAAQREVRRAEHQLEVERRRVQRQLGAAEVEVRQATREIVRQNPEWRSLNNARIAASRELSNARRAERNAQDNPNLFSAEELAAARARRQRAEVALAAVRSQLADTERRLLGEAERAAAFAARPIRDPEDIETAALRRELVRMAPDDPRRRDVQAALEVSIAELERRERPSAGVHGEREVGTVEQRRATRELREARDLLSEAQDDLDAALDAIGDLQARGGSERRLAELQAELPLLREARDRALERVLHARRRRDALNLAAMTGRLPQRRLARLERARSREFEAEQRVRAARERAEAARVARSEAERQVSKETEAPGLVDGEGRPYTLERLRRELRDHGVDPGLVAFISHSPTARGAKNFFQFWARTPNIAPAAGISSRRRTGEAAAKGTFDVDPEVLRESFRLGQGLLDMDAAYKDFVAEFALRHPDGEVRTFRTRGEAEAFARDLMFDEEGMPVVGREWDVVRLNPWNGREDQLAVLLEDVNQTVLEGERLRSLRLDGEDSGGVVSAAIRSALDGEEFAPDGRRLPGPFALVPREAADQLRKHTKLFGPTHAMRALRWFTNVFRRVVLATSPAWLTGNALEGGLRLFVLGSSPLPTKLTSRDYRIGLRVIEQLERSGDADLENAVWRALTGGQFAATQRGRFYTDAMQFADAGRFLSTAARLGATLRQTPVIGRSIQRRTGDELRIPLPGGKSVATGIIEAWEQFTRWMFDSVNNVGIERRVQTAMVGAFARRNLMDRSWLERFLPISERAISDAVAGLRNTAAQVEMARWVRRKYGQYDDFGPGMRQAIAVATPFIAWYLNAVRFLYDVLPRDHPILTGLLAGAYQATEDWRAAQGYDDLPDFLRGSIITSAGPVRVARYTPFGWAADPAGTTAGLLLPQVQDAWLALMGLDWRGMPLRDENGEPIKDQRELAGRAVAELLKSMIPLANQISRMLETEGSLGQRARRVFNPFEPVGGPDRRGGGGEFDWDSALEGLSVPEPDSGPAPGEVPEDFDWDSALEALEGD